MLVIGNGGSNGIDTAFYSRNATQDIKISTFDFTFGFVGRIFYEKGINELVASFIRLQKDYPNIGLRLIGFMEENLYPVDDWVKQEISTNSHIEFVGFQQDVRPYLMGCEALFFPPIVKVSLMLSCKLGPWNYHKSLQISMVVMK